MKLSDLLGKVDESHRLKLNWFLKYKNKNVLWKDTTLENNGLNSYIFTAPKGIFKPAESKYALSIKVMMQSKYPDQQPTIRQDGSWTFKYHQEEEKGKAASNTFTFKAIEQCIQDKVPVGVAIQVSGNPSTFKIMGLALISEIRDNFFQINGFCNLGFVQSDSSYGPYANFIPKIDAFDPESQEDAREKILRQIAQRQGQQKFRRNLLRIYNNTCPISGCNITAVLEAAHITPYLGIDTNNITNGILLRADIHTLWDLRLIAINPEDQKLHISPVLEGSSYEKFKFKKILMNFSDNEKPSIKALNYQWSLFQRNPADK